MQSGAILSRFGSKILHADHEPVHGGACYGGVGDVCGSILHVYVNDGGGHVSDRDPQRSDGVREESPQTAVRDPWLGAHRFRCG